MDITELTVHELQEKLKNKELTVTEITKAYVDRINEKEKFFQNSGNDFFAAVFLRL